MLCAPVMSFAVGIHSLSKFLSSVNVSMWFNYVHVSTGIMSRKHSCTYSADRMLCRKLDYFLYDYMIFMVMIMTCKSPGFQFSYNTSIYCVLNCS